MTESHIDVPHRTSFAPAAATGGGVRRTGKVDPAGIVAVLIYALRLCSITELLFVHRTNRMCAVWSGGMTALYFQTPPTELAWVSHAFA